MQTARGGCAEKRVRDVAWNKNPLYAEIHPCKRQNGNVDTPILYLLLEMCHKTKTIGPARFAGKKSIVVCTIVFICDSPVDR
jgi:hypothetical protein